MSHRDKSPVDPKEIASRGQGETIRTGRCAGLCESIAGTRKCVRLPSRSRPALRFEAVMEEADSGQALEPEYRPGPLPPTSFARWLAPHGVKMADEGIGPFPQNDIGCLHVRDRVSLLRKGLLVSLGIQHSRKESMR
jgi:hypothetical protein